MVIEDRPVDGATARVSRRAVLGAAFVGLAASALGRPAVAVSRVRRLAQTTPTLDGPPFTLGVASGDPRATRVVLWTRLAPLPLEGGGMPDEPVGVRWEVAGDEGFADVVRSGTVTAKAPHAHSVHVDVTGLEPATEYFYRFRLDDHVSPVGRTRTLPAAGASPRQLRLAFASCQDYGTGYYTAYRDFAARDLDVVLFLGDYIYEHGLFSTGERANPATEAATLDDYRHRYALYKTDADLQAAHAALPWIAMWDDHEVENNYAGSVGQEGTPLEEFRARRAAAYRAWYEHQPVRIPPPRGPRVRLYRDFAFGDLTRVFVLDTRQFAPAPPCRDDSQALTDVGPTCSEREQPERTMLGRRQERWLLDGLRGADARWPVVAQPVMLAGLNVNPEGTPTQYYLDSWDGYPAARARLVEGIAQGRGKSPIVLTGDYHASFVSDVRPDPFDLDTDVVGTEFVGPAISSIPFTADFRTHNPHVKYFEARNGYATCLVERDRWTTEFRYVADPRDPQGTAEPGPAFVVERGRPGAEPA